MQKKLVDFKAVSEFGIPSIFAIFITRHFILPAVPERLFSVGKIEFTRDTLLMVVFALLKLLGVDSIPVFVLNVLGPFSCKVKIPFLK